MFAMNNKTDRSVVNQLTRHLNILRIHGNFKSNKQYENSMKSQYAKIFMSSK